MTPGRLACVSLSGALGLAAIVITVVLLALYVRAGRTPAE